MLKDSDKADKLKQSLPPGGFFLVVWSGSVGGMLWVELRKGRGKGGYESKIGGTLKDWLRRKRVVDRWLIDACAGLTISDVPKRNKKGKRVA